jgi:hypothetical protein
VNNGEVSQVDNTKEDSKYGRYVIQNPIDYGYRGYCKLLKKQTVQYNPEGFWGPNVWFRGNTDFNNDFTLMFIRVEEDMAMEVDSHVHDFDMYVFLIPLEPHNMEDLGCEVEMVYGSGEEQEVHVLTKTGCFFVPKGVVHGPFTFRNITKPILFVHTMRAETYYKTESFK